MQQKIIPLILLALFPLCLLANSGAEAHINRYIQEYWQLAVKEMYRSGIPASVTLAQGIHESKWGTSELALQANNHFGIKCKSSWTKEGFYVKDDDRDKHGHLIKSCFRTYQSSEESFFDHSNFLKNNSRYDVLFTYKKTDYAKWAKGLQKCGYATDKQYARKLIKTIDRFQLYIYDKKPIPNGINDEEWMEIPKEEALLSVAIEQPPAAVSLPKDYGKSKDIYAKFDDFFTEDEEDEMLFASEEPIKISNKKSRTYQIYLTTMTEKGAAKQTEVLTYRPKK